MIIRKIIGILFVLISSSIQAFTQCDEALEQIAINESGIDALFIKEFRVKLKKGKANRPIRIAKFNSFLKDSTVYRFNIVSDKNFEGKAILQLSKKGKILGSTYNIENNTFNSSFDYYCSQSSNYQILISFNEGRAGCALGILSIVLNDSSVITKNLDSNKLYLGIANPLYIAYTDEPGTSIKVSSSQGTIEGTKGKYSIKPKVLGNATVIAETIDSVGNVIEKISKDFIVEELPTPVLSINGNISGLINKFELRNIQGPELSITSIYNSKEYKILSFTISKSPSDINGYKSTNEKFSYQQTKFLNSLSSGSEFSITKIKVIRPDNKIINVPSINYIIQ